MVTIKDIKTSYIRTLNNDAIDFIPNLGEKVIIKDDNGNIVMQGVVCNIQHNIANNKFEHDLTIFVY